MGTAEKRGKESSDEDGTGDEKGSGKGSEAEPAQDGSSGDDDYRQVKTKRQKLKEKKKRQKAKKAEAARLTTLLVPDVERERLWLLDSLKPSPEAIDQALAGHPATHPQLLRLLMTADSLYSFCTELDPDPSFVHTLLRRLVLSPAPLTLEAVQSACSLHNLTL